METAGPESFATLLHRYRLAAGLSQEALAERAGLSARAISDLERGARRTPYRETVRLIGAALGLGAADRAALEAAVDRGRGPRLEIAPSAALVTSALPASLTPLIGRDPVVSHLRAQVRGGDLRLLTLTGPPGIGKTRLAHEVAAGLVADFPDGMFAVGLAPIVETRLVATSILQALGLTEVGERAAPDRLKDVLRKKRTLLVLDNFEHVIGAASLVGELLEASPRLVVMVTSRIALRLRGEHEYQVPPLALPDDPMTATVEALGNSAAVSLFVERARAVRAGFTLTPENVQTVVEICRRLDGLPLAIELAAARCKVLTPQAMLDRFEHRLDLLTGGARDAPARHRTLRAAIAWSHDLLSPDEKMLFRRLGIFVGGCTLSAVERVCAVPDERIDALDGISGLVDQSLVQVDGDDDSEPRVSMLETLREFALEQVDAAGERDILQERHAIRELEFAQEAEPYLFGGDRGRWLRRLSEDQDNIRAALRWAVSQQDPALGLGLVGALWMWFLRRLLVEGREWAETLLSLPGAQQASAVRAKALFAAGHFAWLQGDVRTMRARLEEAVTIQRSLGDAAGLGRSLPFYGLTLDDYEAARRLAKEGAGFCRTVDDQWGLAMALTNLGRIEATWGHDSAALPPLREATALFRSIGDGWLLALPLTSIGAIAYRLGDLGQAEASFDEALPRFQAVEDRRNTAQVLTNLGFCVLARGETSRAQSLFAESLVFGREHGDRFNGPACLRGLAATARALGEPERAVRLFAAADRMSASTGTTRWPAERLGGPVAIDDLRDTLGEDECSRLWQAGRRLSLEEAAAEAIAGPVAGSITSAGGRLANPSF